MTQSHKEFIGIQFKELIQRHLKNEMEGKYIQQVLSIAKTRFFALLKVYISKPNEFSFHRP